jgi:hypothetical protein
MKIKLMKKILILSATIFAMSCGKKAATADLAAPTSKNLTAKVNDKLWESKTAARDASTAAFTYSYYSSLSADGRIISLMAYGTVGTTSTQPADKLAIVITSFTGAGRYVIKSAGVATAVFAPLSAEAVPVDVYNSDDNAENFINVQTVAGNKISGTFSFTAISASGTARLTNGIFSDVAY